MQRLLRKLQGTPLMEHRCRVHLRQVFLFNNRLRSLLGLRKELTPYPKGHTQFNLDTQFKLDINLDTLHNLEQCLWLSQFVSSQCRTYRTIRQCTLVSIDN